MSEPLMETKVKEVKDETGAVIQKITELWVEKKPMELKSRVVEKISSTPIVLEKVIESYENGVVVDSTKEALDHISVVNSEPKAFVPAEKFKGLTEMQERVVGNPRKWLDIILSCIITGLVVYIAVKMF